MKTIFALVAVCVGVLAGCAGMNNDQMKKEEMMKKDTMKK